MDRDLLNTIDILINTIETLDNEFYKNIDNITEKYSNKSYKKFHIIYTIDKFNDNISEKLDEFKTRLFQNKTKFVYEDATKIHNDVITFMGKVVSKIDYINSDEYIIFDNSEMSIRNKIIDDILKKMKRFEEYFQEHKSDYDEDIFKNNMEMIEYDKSILEDCRKNTYYTPSDMKGIIQNMYCERITYLNVVTNSKTESFF